MILIIVSAILLYLKNKNIYKCYIFIIDNLFGEKKKLKNN